MGPADAIDFLCDAIPAGATVILRSSPGGAKSSIVKQAIEKLKRNCIEFRPAIHDPVDILGIPFVQDGVTQWAKPSFFPTDKNDVLFVDEIGQANAAMQTVCAQLLWEHRAGVHALPEGCGVVGATNRQDDRAGVHRILTQLANRAVWIDLEVSNDDWQTWAAGNGIDSIVRSFLRFRPENLYKFDAKSDQLAYPTLRSWETVSRKILPFVREKCMFPAVTGTIGEGVAAEFMAFRKTFLELPDPATILANPKGARMPKDASVLWATIGALAGIAKTASDAGLNAMATFALRMQAEASDCGGVECGICLVKDCWRLNPKMKTVPETMKFLGANKAVLFNE